MLRLVLVLLASLYFVLSYTRVVADGDMLLKKRVSDLEIRMAILEKRVAQEKQSNDWKDPIYWQKIKKEMLEEDVKKLIGKPHHIEQQIFMTWYYHPSSKVHSFVWFDEGKVLGWKMPD